jgi:capsular polysaccharide transport system permease protein
MVAGRTVASGLLGKPRILAALVVRETTARFGRTWGGYFWAVGEPLGGIVLLSVAFSWLVHVPPLGKSFALFYATGLIPFLMYNGVAAGAMNALSANKGLLVYPVVTPLDTVLARTVLECLTYVVIAALFFPALLWVEGVDPVIDPARVAASLALAGALGLGVGSANAAIAAFWPTWRQIWSVLNRPLFIASGVLFPFESVPVDMRPVVWANPISHVIAEMRAGFYGADQALHAGPAYVALIAAATFAAGGMLLVRHKTRFAQ